MLSKVHAKSPSRRCAPQPATATVLLIRKLVAQAIHGAPTPPARSDSGQKRDVLFACEVDGVRCTLMRAEEPARKGEHAELSPRESEIARMISKGYPNKAIADVLDISVWTVSTHLRRVFAKLGVNSRAAMVAKFIDLPATSDPMKSSTPPRPRA